MKYNGVVLSVKDIELSKTFYEDLFGLELYQDYGINKSFTCGLSLQQEFDWLVGIDKSQIQLQPNNIELSFEEDDFDEFLSKLKKYPNIQYLGDVVTHSWGQRVIRFYDLDGHLIEVGECMKMVIKRFLSMDMTFEEIAKKMDISIKDIEILLNE